MSTSSHKILLGITGSIAAVKAPELVRLLKDKGYSVRCVLTKSAEKFVSPLVLSTFCGEPAFSDIFSPEAYTMPHLKYAEEADLMVIAPASTTIVARCANGLADDMVTLCYVTTKAPLIIAPAMHTSMWEHPATQANVKLLKARGVQFVGPYQGPLADSTRGEGRMAEPDAILKSIETLLLKKKK